MFGNVPRKIHDAYKGLRPLDRLHFGQMRASSRLPLLRWYKSFVPPRLRRPVRWIWAIALGSAVLWGQFSARSAALAVYFYDVGQGDAIHIRAADGFDVLIDGGPTDRVAEKLGRTLPFWDKDIELMVLTHPHADHVTGLLEVLKRFKVKRVLATGVLHTTDEYLAWLKEIKAQGIPMDIAKAGQEFAVGASGASRLEILYPEDDFSGKRAKEGKIGEGGGLNDTSIVARLTYDNTSFLLMGDATSKVEEGLVEKYGEKLASDLLKVGHHGSKYSTSREFLEAVRPKYAVIQVGKNTYGHPAFATLWRLKNAEVQVLRNDKDGDIVFESDGKSLKHITASTGR